MKSRNTMTAALLAVLMLLQTLAMGVGAVTLPTPHAHTQESTTAGGTALEPITIAPYINPLYADVITEDDLVKPRDNVPPTLNASGIAEDGEPTLENAVAAMREGLRRREETIVVSAMVSEWTSEAVTALTHEISDKALEHTGVPEEGDYIRWHYGGWRSSTSGSSVAGGYKATVTYTVTYYTTAEQEQAVDAKVDAVLAELDVADADDYTKIKAVYDYICENVTYDYDTLEDDSYKLKYSAYAALINGTAVCQGYAQLLYRFALELGVDARLIAGDGGGPHAWNILELEDLYYNADSTWDAGYPYYNYFLCCPETFTDHIRYEEYDTAEFHAAYPMGEEDYAYHVWDAGVITKEATCAEVGETTYTCTLCGETRTEEIAVLEHGFVETERIPSTCVEYGVITYTCTVCEATMTEEIPEYAEHSYLDGACEVCGEEDPSFVITGVVIDETNFPDATFRQYVTANFDADSNGALSEDEIAQITAIDVSGLEIESLQGIAYFGALEELYCSDNLLTALDVGGNPALKMLYCDINRLTALDIGNNPALEELYCFDNSLTALDVSHNPALKLLHCSENRLTTLDVANNPALITLNCSDNLLTALDVGNNTALETLSCSTNQLQALDVSRNTAVHTLHCSGNRLTALDIRHNTALLYLHCDNNLLTSLDIGGNPVLQILNCDNNQLTALDASNNTAFTKLYCSNNLLTALDVSGCAAMDVLICSDNRLTNIDLSENSLLTDVSFDGNTFEANVSNGAFDLNTLPGAFDVAKTSDWTGGTVNYETGILTVDDGATAVSYVYDTGYTGTEDTAKQVTFTLLILIDDTPHTHTYGDWTTVTAPSCTEDGEEARICDGCGESETKVIPAVGHDYEDTVVPPSCTEDGYTTHICAVCEDSYDDTVVPATGHDYEKTVVAPTEEAGGYSEYVCKICGDTYRDEFTDPLEHTHTYGDWTTITAPSCTEDGEEARTCTACDESETKVIPAVGHDFVETARVPSTCTEYGVITYTCANCDATYTEEIGQLAEHRYVDGVCEMCGEEEPGTEIPDIPTAPAVPEILSCYSKAQTSVKVTWTTVDGADGYELYRATSPDGTWELKKTVKDGTQDRYTNQGLEIGTTYYYKVRSYVLTDDTLADEIGNRTYSDFSNVSYMPAAVVFDAPYSNATFRVRLRWNEIGGAHGYQIWRMNEDGSYSIVKTLGDRGNTLTNNQGNVTAYSNTGLESGETYTYKMRAFMITDDGRKVFGAYSDEYKVAAMPLAPSATATGTKAGRAVITWESVNGGAGYQIWMATSEDGTYSIVKSVTDPTVSSYTKYDLESGKTYYFKVRTYTEVDGKKTFGAYSEVLAVTVK